MGMDNGGLFRELMILAPRNILKRCSCFLPSPNDLSNLDTSFGHLGDHPVKSLVPRLFYGSCPVLVGTVHRVRLLRRMVANDVAATTPPAPRTGN